MTVTALQSVRIGNLVTLTATSDLAAPVYYHWWIDGEYVGQSTSPTRTLYLAAGEQARVTVEDTVDPDYDPEHLPASLYSPRRTLWWVRSLDTDVAKYRVEQSLDGAVWTSLGEVPHSDTTWTYWLVTGRLEDLTTYYWRVVPVDAAGNDGTPLEHHLGQDYLVRVPDAPRFTIAFDDETAKVTFAADS